MREAVDTVKSVTSLLLGKQDWIGWMCNPGKCPVTGSDSLKENRCMLFPERGSSDNPVMRSELMYLITACNRWGSLGGELLVVLVGCWRYRRMDRHISSWGKQSTKSLSLELTSMKQAGRKHRWVSHFSTSNEAQEMISYLERIHYSEVSYELACSSCHWARGSQSQGHIETNKTMDGGRACSFFMTPFSIVSAKYNWALLCSGQDTIAATTVIMEDTCLVSSLVYQISSNGFTVHTNNK